MRNLRRALAVIGATLFAASLAQAQPKVGAKPADFTVTQLNGKPIKLSKLRGGKPVLVNFWATW